MALPNVGVYHNASSTYLNDVQSLTMRQGRMNVSDVYRGGTATVTGRDPDSLPTLAIGDEIIVTIDFGDPTYELLRTFRVADFRISYGIVSNQDTYTVDLEDAFAFLGRGTVTYTALSGDSVFDTAYEACDQNGVVLTENGTTASETNAQTLVAANALDVLQTCITTEQARVYAGSSDLSWYSRGYWLANLNTVTFSDDGTGTFTYTGIDFGSKADDYATEVIVSVRGGSDVVSGVGDFSIGVNSYSVSTAEAEYLGDYLLGTLSVTDATIQSLTYQAHTQTALAVFGPVGVNALCSVKFRGSTYRGIVEGYSLSATPQSVNVTLNLSDASFYNFFVLDDPVLGKLDENKLGW